MQSFTVVSKPSLILFNTFPKRAPIYRMRLRMKSGHILLTKGVVDLLGLDDDVSSVAFAYDDKGRPYITKSDHKESFRVHLRSDKGENVGAMICSIALVRHFGQTLDSADAGFINLPVLKYATDAVEVGLSKDDHPNKLFRIAVENKTVEAIKA